MKDNCPVMMQSEERNAPWNEKEPIPIQVDCTVCYCMSKSMPVEIINHNDNYSEFEDINFIEEYKNDNHAMGIPTLLYELQNLCNKKITEIEDRLNGANSYHSSSNYEALSKDLKHYMKVLKATKDWVVDDLDVIKD